MLENVDMLSRRYDVCMLNRALNPFNIKDNKKIEKEAEHIKTRKEIQNCKWKITYFIKKRQI